MKRLCTLVALVSTLGLSACTSPPPKTKYQVFLPSDTLLTVRPTPKPPLSPQDYSLLSSWEQKEKVWSDYAATLVLHIGLDKADKEGLLDWKTKVGGTVKKLNEAGK